MARPSRTAAARLAPVKKRGFISYAHDDVAGFKEFQTYLKGALRGFPSVEVDADHSIRAGDGWHAEILKKIGQAHIFILLIGPEFLASDFICNHELPAIRRRKQEVGALLIPVILHKCLWRQVCGAVQAVPMDNGHLVPIRDWKPHRNGFARAQEEIAAAIEKHFELPMQSFDWSAK
jgi:hypothetical protein